MTGEQYRNHLDLLAAACRLLLLVPVDELLDVIGKSETLEPILEPTAWERGGARRLAEQRQVLQAAQTLRNTILRLQPIEGYLVNIDGRQHAVHPEDVTVARRTER